MGVMEARRRILLNQPHLIDASGNPISFSTDMAAKMGVKAYFSPVQEGTGDPSPQNIRPISGIQGYNVWRTGGNMFDPQLAISTAYQGANGYVNSNGSLTITARDQTGNKQRGHITLPPGTYDFYSEFGSGYKSRYTINDSNTETVWYGKQTVAITEQTDFYFRAAMNNSDDYSYPVTGWLQIFKSGETYTEKPYSGSSYPVTFPAVGKNLLNPSKCRANSIWYNGNLTGWTSGWFASDKIPITPGETYVGTGRDNQQNQYCFFDENGDYISQSFVSGTNPVTAPSNAYYIATQFLTTEQATAQFEKGSTATSYEPFTNTLYGGYVDYEKGEVVAEYGTVDLSKAGWVYGGGDGTIWNSPSTFPFKQVANTDVANAYCDKLYVRSYSSFSHNTSRDLSIAIDPAGAPRIRYNEYDNSTKTEFIEFLSTVQLVAELATPIHYPLAPQIIKSLKGANTIWSDMNGNLEIGYWKH